jgi:GDP-L-fucose synthase
MPTNLYGTFDNFSTTSSHVLPALIRKFHDAKLKNENQVTLWGTGKPQRELMEVDDFARALTLVINKYDDEETINIGVGKDQTIREIAQIIKEVIGFNGEIVWDTSKPDGTPRKLLEISKLRTLGFEPEFNLKEGVAKTYKWFLEQIKLKSSDLRL